MKGSIVVSAGIIGFAIGLVSGTLFGFSISCCMSASSAADRAFEKLQNAEKGEEDGK